ncbi:hypothetical protein SAMD00019534_069280, partial [Acytostelium subglobosum LB1]|uniref:hypothetical protein n=1 Tax=Acytostelium subglobosum LB1 TaxID=1410327 RepID=UPI000644F6A1
MSTTNNQRQPLDGVIVLEMAGLAPVPYCGMILADFGATVIRVDRVVNGEAVATPFDHLTRGKQSIAIDLKSAQGRELLATLAQRADVLIDSFRPGVMEKLGLGPQQLMINAPRLIYARLTGFGQTGPYSKMAGHDINYIALSGALSLLGRHNENPLFPSNYLGDFAAGSLLCALGIVLALVERSSSGRGKLIDASMMDGAAYLSTFMWQLKKKGGMWDGERGTNMLDSGAHYYEVYKTRDGRYMSVGAIEPQFYECLIKGLGLDGRTDLPEQNDQAEWPRMKKLLQEIFMTKTRDEWESVFFGTDACVAPVLELEELPSHPQSKARSLMFQSKSSAASTDVNDQEMMSSPRIFNMVADNHNQLSLASSLETQQKEQIQRLADRCKQLPLNAGANTTNILKQFGVEQYQIEKLLSNKYVVQDNNIIMAKL